MYPTELPDTVRNSTMNETKETLNNLEQHYKLFRQQQTTFITALERCRQNAHDRIKCVRNLDQVCNYLDNYCNNSTDKRILALFLSICSDITDFCFQLNQQFNILGVNNLLEENLKLFNLTYDFSSLRAKFPHDVINHLSCDEAKNFYGGIVSLIPIGMDHIKEAVAKMEKELSQPVARSHWKNRQHSKTGENEQAATHTTGVQTRVSHQDSKNKGSIEPFKPAWKPSGSFTH